ncbi:DUF1253-domain-containing protein [Hesseltinella vesiculosa]|uniref:U3 small nucleolar RNA-associated protein 25 n=1 Tax=Hesseltinella vesiculosa TaxID=101127 RepID=A0A1X2GHC2_9FUNG|nr:DUF1253-domain-containing protein [Hesseltinella vesiculosa]
MGRSAISKSMKKKTTDGHVSGLSTGKPASAKRKDGPVKFGSMSRKDRQQIMDYGELVPSDFNLDQEEGPATQRRKVVHEEDLDREREANDEDSEDESDLESNGEEEEWEKPSAYSLLMGSLKKTSKNKDFYQKIEKEQEGLEDDGEEVDDDEDEESEALDEDMDDGDDAELSEEAQDMDQETDVDEGDDTSASDSDNDNDNVEDDVEDDEDEDEDDDDEPEQDDGRNHIYDSRFSDEQSADFDERISLIEQKKWKLQSYHDDVLQDVVFQSPQNEAALADSKPITDLQDAQFKEKLINRWAALNKDCVQKGKSLTPLQAKLLTQMSQYQDILYGSRSLDNKKEIRNAYAIHAMNHVSLARDRVTKNNSKLEDAQAKGNDAGELRDQGFTRPKVLILLPFRNAVVDVVDALIKLCGSENVQNKKRFYEQFNLRDDDSLNKDKPADYLDTFHGNIDDHFRLGVKITKKSIKLYSQFYHSDILICSPLGLKTLIGSEGDKKRDFDYLSSIEMFIIDQATDMTMQNWDHVDHIFKHLNLIPIDSHDCDISRIRSWYLDGNAKYLRQTLVFSDYLTPELNAMYTRYLKNVSGRLKIKHAYEGSIMDVSVDVPQQFTRVDSTSLATMDDTRFKYFVEKTLPSLRKSAIMQTHTLFFIPSYFDFVRIRNYLEDNKYEYEPCCEYTSSGGLTRARAQFFHGRTSFILYTERLHYYRRFNIRGTYHVVFYGLPDHPQFYNEIVDFLGLKVNDHASAAEEATFSCTALFSKYDFLKLERIVGTDRAKKMCTAQKNTFQFA